MTGEKLYLFQFDKKSISDCDCEICSENAKKVVVIDQRVPGKERGGIHNNIALCGYCIDKYHGKNGYNEKLLSRHNKVLLSIVETQN